MLDMNWLCGPKVITIEKDDNPLCDILNAISDVHGDYQVPVQMLMKHMSYLLQFNEYRKQRKLEDDELLCELYEQTYISNIFADLFKQFKTKKIDDNGINILLSVWKKMEEVLNNSVKRDFISKMKEMLCGAQKCLDSHERDNLPEIPLFNFYYRGEGIASRPIAPSIYRSQNEIIKESFYYHEMRVRCPSEFLGKKALSSLVQMQHYGCYTRLLDVTSSPLPSLYFACEKHNSGNDVQDGVVYLFPVVSGSISYSESDKGLILSCLAHLSYSEQKQILEEILEYLKDPFNNNTSVYSICLEKLFHQIQIEKPAFQRRINFGDILNPLFIQPEKNNPRISNQDGAFILSGLSPDKSETERKIADLVGAKIIIKGNLKKKILEQLEMLGINHGKIYPDIEHVATYLKSV